MENEDSWKNVNDLESENMIYYYGMCDWECSDSDGADCLKDGLMVAMNANECFVKDNEECGSISENGAL
jgi:hypothetical protein